MKKKRGLLFSGCGTWDAYNVGALERLNIDYDVIVGISTGCLLTPMIGLKEWEILKSSFLSIEIKDVYDFKWYGFFPITDEGKIRIFPIIRTLLTGNKTISTSNVLRKTIDNKFSREYFDELKKNNINIFVGARNYSETPAKMHYFSSLSEEYEEYKDWMWCGANFPFLGSFVKKSWKDSIGGFHVGNWSGGGLSVFNGIEQLINKGLDEVDIFISRPKLVESYEGNKINNLVDNVFTSVTTINYLVESEHFYSVIKKMTCQGTRVRIFWLPRELSSNPISIYGEDMNEWWDEGYETALELNRVEVFESKKKNSF